MGTNNTQVLMFYVHGTINTPASNTAEYIAATKSPYNAVYGNNNVKVDNTFDWSSKGVINDLSNHGTAGVLNQQSDRTIAASNLTTHIDNYIRTGISNGSIDPNKPLKIVLDGFSHGGNVSLQAAPDVAALKDKYGIKTMSIDVNGYNTPQYYNNVGNTVAGNNNPEDPAVVNSRVKTNGVTLNHNAFSTVGDAVGGKGELVTPSLSQGGVYPNNGITKRIELTAPGTVNTLLSGGSEKHGAVISNQSTRKQAAGKLYTVLRSQKAKEDLAQRGKVAPRIGR